MATDNILTLTKVSKRFGGLWALRDVTMNLPRGKVTLIIGPNGAGKTTLVNVIDGVYKPDDGRIFFEGSEITGRKPHEIEQRGIARTFQIPAPFPSLTVLESVLVATDNFRKHGESFVWSIFKRLWAPAEEKSVKTASEIAEQLNLGALRNNLSGELSGGQSKLLELGRAIMTGKKLLILDEPIAGVAPTLAHELMARILSLKNESGITFLIIEHRLDIALQYVDNVVVFFDGSIIAQGEPDAVMRDQRVIEAYLGGPKR